MRIKFNFGPNTAQVPNNMSVNNSWLHKCLGNNNKYHDSPSHYCVTRLSGGIYSGRYVNFPKGGYIIVSTNDEELVKRLINNTEKVELGYGMEFLYEEFIGETMYDGYNFFSTTDSGLLLRSFKGNGVNTIHKVTDANFVDTLTEHTVRRLKTINPKLDFTNFKIEIPVHKGNHVKRSFVGDVLNMTNVCQFIIHSNKTVAEAVYTYGLGQSTGSGFGLIFKTENKEKHYFLK